MKIQIFVTGGTFDKTYNELDGSLFFKETHLPEMLDLGRCKLDVQIDTLMLMDSLDMSNTDKENLVQACENCELDKIVITHGTDTMVDSAKLIANRISGSGKTVVLTGAMIPYKFGSSDGLFNLGSALSFVQALEPGVYIAMNGEVFTYDNCVKNREVGRFMKLVK